jgi:hypothetical protein
MAMIPDEGGLDWHSDLFYLDRFKMLLLPWDIKNKLSAGKTEPIQRQTREHITT